MKKKIFCVLAIVALISVLCFGLVACNAQTYEKKLEKAGYTVAVADKDNTTIDGINKVLEKAGGYSGKVQWQVAGTKGFNSVSIIKFSKISDAKKFAETLPAVPGIEKKVISTYVIYGTVEGVKAAK